MKIGIKLTSVLLGLVLAVGFTPALAQSTANTQSSASVLTTYYATDLETRPGSITVSAGYLTVVEFWADVDQVSSGKATLVKADVSANKIYLSTGATNGATDLIVEAGGRTLMFTLKINGVNSPKRYVIKETKPEPVATETPTPAAANPTATTAQPAPAQPAPAPVPTPPAAAKPSQTTTSTLTNTPEPTDSSTVSASNNEVISGTNLTIGNWTMPYERSVELPNDVQVYLDFNINKSGVATLKLVLDNRSTKPVMTPENLVIINIKNADGIEVANLIPSNISKNIATVSAKSKRTQTFTLQMNQTRYADIGILSSFTTDKTYVVHNQVILTSGIWLK